VNAPAPAPVCFEIDDIPSLRRQSNEHMMKIGTWICCVLLCTAVAFAAEQKTKNVNVDEFAKLRDGKTNVVLDVRTAEEYKAGHIPGAVLLDIKSPDFQEKVAKLDKSKTYLVHCAAGGRSARACKQMEGLGFSNLVNLSPGFKGWEKAGKPVEK
jgi:phage shock protein E